MSMTVISVTYTYTSDMIKHFIILLFAIAAFSEARPLPCPILNEQLGSVLCCETEGQGTLKRCTEHLPINSFKSLKVWSQTTIDLANDLIKRTKSNRDGLNEILTENVGDDSNRRRQVEADAKNILGDLNFPKSCCCDERKEIVALSEGYSYEQGVKYKIYQELPLMGQAVMQSTCSSNSCTKKGVNYTCMQVHTFVPQYVVDSFSQYLRKVPIRIDKGCICKIENEGKSNWKKIFIRSIDKSPHKRQINADNFMEGKPITSTESHLRETIQLQNVLNTFGRVKSKLDTAYRSFVTKLTNLRRDSTSLRNVESFVNNFHDAAALIHIATKLMKVNISSQDPLLRKFGETTLHPQPSDQKPESFTTLVSKFPGKTIKKGNIHKESYTSPEIYKPLELHNQYLEKNGSTSPMSNSFPKKSSREGYFTSATLSSSTDSSPIHNIYSKHSVDNSSLTNSHASPVSENENNESLNSSRTTLKQSTHNLSKSFDTSNVSSVTKTISYPSNRKASFSKIDNIEMKEEMDLTRVAFDEKARTDFGDAKQKYTRTPQAPNSKTSISDSREDHTSNYDLSVETKRKTLLKTSTITLSGETARRTTTGSDANVENISTHFDNPKVFISHDNSDAISTPSDSNPVSSYLEVATDERESVTTSATKVRNKLFTDNSSEDISEALTTVQPDAKTPRTITSRDSQNFEFPKKHFASSVTEESMVSSFSPDGKECITRESVTLSSTELKGILDDSKESFDATAETTSNAGVTNLVSLDWIKDEENALEGCTNKPPKKVNIESTDDKNASLMKLEYTVPIRSSIEPTSQSNEVSTKKDFTGNELSFQTTSQFNATIQDSNTSIKSPSLKTEGVYTLNSMDHNLDKNFTSMENAFVSLTKSVHSSSLKLATTEASHKSNAFGTSEQNDVTVFHTKEPFLYLDIGESNESIKMSPEKNKTKAIDTIKNQIQGKDSQSYQEAKTTKSPSDSVEDAALKQTPNGADEPQMISNTLLDLYITTDKYSTSPGEPAFTTPTLNKNSPHDSTAIYRDGATSTDASYIYQGESKSWTSSDILTRASGSALPFAPNDRSRGKIIENALDLSTPTNKHRMDFTSNKQPNYFSYTKSTEYELPYTVNNLDTTNLYAHSNTFSPQIFWSKPLKTAINCQVICAKKNNLGKCSLCNCCSESLESTLPSTKEKNDLVTEVKDLNIGSTSTPMQRKPIPYISDLSSKHGKNELIEEVKVSLNSEKNPQSSKLDNTNSYSKISQECEINKAIEEILRHVSRIILKELGVKSEPCEASFISLDLLKDQEVSPLTLLMIENVLCSTFRTCFTIDGRKLALITATSEHLLRPLQTSINQLTKIIRSLILSLEMRKVLSYSGAVLEGNLDSIESEDESLYRVLLEKLKGIHLTNKPGMCRTKNSPSRTKDFQNENLGAKGNVEMATKKEQETSKLTHNTKDDYEHTFSLVTKKLDAVGINNLPIRSSLQPLIGTSTAGTVNHEIQTLPETRALEAYDKEAELPKVEDYMVVQSSKTLNTRVSGSLSSSNKWPKEDLKYQSQDANEKEDLDSPKPSLKSNKYEKAARSSGGVETQSLKTVEMATIKDKYPLELVSSVTESSGKSYAKVTHTTTKKLKNDINLEENLEVKLSKADTNGDLVTKVPLSSPFRSRLAINNSQDTISVSKDHLEMAIQNKKKYVE